jgi:hypothetical protein
MKVSRHVAFFIEENLGTRRTQLDACRGMLPVVVVVIAVVSDGSAEYRGHHSRGVELRRVQL